MKKETYVKVNTVVRSTMKGATSVMVLKTRVTVIAGGISWGCTNGQRNSGGKQYGHTTAVTKERREKQRKALRVLKTMVNEFTVCDLDQRILVGLISNLNMQRFRYAQFPQFLASHQ
jgi:hypothetical protein